MIGDRRRTTARNIRGVILDFEQRLHGDPMFTHVIDNVVQAVVLVLLIEQALNNLTGDRGPQNRIALVGSTFAQPRLLEDQGCLRRYPELLSRSARRGPSRSRAILTFTAFFLPDL